MYILTEETHGYYGDYATQPRRLLARTLRAGFAYQGEPSAHRGGRPRGERIGALPPAAFVNFLQNHDQSATARWVIVSSGPPTRGLLRRRLPLRCSHRCRP